MFWSFRKIAEGWVEQYNQTYGTTYTVVRGGPPPLRYWLKSRKYDIWAKCQEDANPGAEPVWVRISPQSMSIDFFCDGKLLPAPDLPKPSERAPSDLKNTNKDPGEIVADLPTEKPANAPKYWRCKLDREYESAMMLMGLHLGETDRYVYGFDVNARMGNGARAFLYKIQDAIDAGAAPHTINYDRDDVQFHIARLENVVRIDVFLDHMWMDVVYTDSTTGEAHAIEFFKQSQEGRSDLAIEIADALGATKFEFNRGPIAGQVEPQRTRSTLADPSQALGAGSPSRQLLLSGT